MGIFLSKKSKNRENITSVSETTIDDTVIVDLGNTGLSEDTIAHMMQQKTEKKIQQTKEKTAKKTKEKKKVTSETLQADTPKNKNKTRGKTKKSETPKTPIDAPMDKSKVPETSEEAHDKTPEKKTDDMKKEVANLDQALVEIEGNIVVTKFALTQMLQILNSREAKQKIEELTNLMREIYLSIAKKGITSPDRETKIIFDNVTKMWEEQNYCLASALCESYKNICFSLEVDGFSLKQSVLRFINPDSVQNNTKEKFFIESIDEYKDRMISRRSMIIRGISVEKMVVNFEQMRKDFRLAMSRDLKQKIALKTSSTHSI